jgi:RNA polymerase sigma factor (sigma-70 family)
MSKARQFFPSMNSELPRQIILPEWNTAALKLPVWLPCGENSLPSGSLANASIRQGDAGRFWQATCILAVMRCESTFEMQSPATNRDRCVAMSGHQSAVLEMKEVLSLRLPSFYRCALRLLGNAADAEDAVQEALLAAYRHIGQFRGQAQMSTWLTPIVRNCALMQLRKRARHIYLSLDESIGGEEKHFVSERLLDWRPGPEDEFRHSELNARLRRYAAMLSPTVRRTFQLRVMQGLSICETAQILGVPSGTVKAQLARARKSIARHIKPGLAPRSQTPPRIPE